jgi:hypothetical protein
VLRPALLGRRGSAGRKLSRIGRRPTRALRPNANQVLESGPRLGRLSCQGSESWETLRVLHPLAFWMHETSPGVGLFKEKDLQRELTRILPAVRGGTWTSSAVGPWEVW